LSSTLMDATQDYLKRKQSKKPIPTKLSFRDFFKMLFEVFSFFSKLLLGKLKI
jgi:hypothetical protein